MKVCESLGDLSHAGKIEFSTSQQEEQSASEEAGNAYFEFNYIVNLMRTDLAVGGRCHGGVTSTHQSSMKKNAALDAKWHVLILYVSVFFLVSAS
jgi:hypothetical protein